MVITTKVVIMKACITMKKVAGVIERSAKS
jgi:hypothetical protein